MSDHTHTPRIWLLTGDKLGDNAQVQVLADALGFAGCAMIRRTLGLAHNIDFEQIADPDRRAVCERANLKLARELLTERQHFATIEAVTARARIIEAGG